MRNVDERKQMAESFHNQGYNCSQCVMMVYDDCYQIPVETMAKISAGFGGGFGGQGEVCGVVSAMTILKGILKYRGAKTKMSLYNEVKDISEIFKCENGSIICRELRGSSSDCVTNTCIKKKPCMDYIKNAIDIINYNMIEG